MAKVGSIHGEAYKKDELGRNGGSLDGKKNSGLLSRPQRMGMRDLERGNELV
jgi:hypothetical protein